jgi:hypothetical protein
VSRSLAQGFVRDLGQRELGSLVIKVHTLKGCTQ